MFDTEKLITVCTFGGSVCPDSNHRLALAPYIKNCHPTNSFRSLKGTQSDQGNLPVSSSLCRLFQYCRRTKA